MGLRAVGPKANLSRSTPVRLALGLVAVFAAVNLFSLGVAYLTLRADLEASLRASLAQEIAGLDLTATPRALATLVSARARAADPASTVLVYIAPDGRISGNAEARLDGGQLTLRARPRGDPLGEAGYLHEMRSLSGGILVVAESLAPIGQLGDTFLWLLVVSLVPTLAVSMGAGVFLARRAARRVDEIEAALDKVAAGHLAARVPEGGAPSDDLARIGSGVNRMAARQEAATEALRQVTVDIAHDLKTPVQRIGVLLHDLAERLPDGCPETALAVEAGTEADRAVSVFQSLLQIAQIEGGSPAARFGPVDLVSVAEQFCDLYEPAAEEGGRTLLRELPDAPVTVTGDRNLIGQALANLIDNALGHTPSGSQVTVSVLDRPEGPALSVADDGPGIPPGERGNVLRRLYRLERSRTTPGHGLGLSLVAAIATLHGASVRLADNTPGLVVMLSFGTVRRP